MRGALAVFAVLIGVAAAFPTIRNSADEGRVMMEEWETNTMIARMIDNLQKRITALEVQRVPEGTHVNMDLHFSEREMADFHAKLRDTMNAVPVEHNEVDVLSSLDTILYYVYRVCVLIALFKILTIMCG